MLWLGCYAFGGVSGFKVFGDDEIFRALAASFFWLRDFWVEGVKGF